MLNSIIETERCLIRPLSLADAAGIFELDSNPNVHTFLGKNPIKTIEDAENVIKFIQKQYIDLGIGRWAVIDRANGDFIGWTGFKYIIEPINNHANYHDFGYRLIERYWGKGIATETGKACIKYAFETLNLEVINGICEVGNIGSVNVLQKCGLQLKDNFLYEDIPHYWFELQKTAWIKQTGPNNNQT